MSLGRPQYVDITFPLEQHFRPYVDVLITPVEDALKACELQVAQYGNVQRTSHWDVYETSYFNVLRTSVDHVLRNSSRDIALALHRGLLGSFRDVLRTSLRLNFTEWVVYMGTYFDDIIVQHSQKLFPITTLEIAFK